MSTRKKSKALNKAAFSAAIMVALSAVPGHNVLAATDLLDVDAEILATGQQIVATQNLDFGDLSEVTGGTATIPPTGGGINTTGSVISQGGGFAPGQILTIGNPGDNIDFTVPAGPVVLNGSLGGTMTVDSFNIGTLGGGEAYNATLPGTSMNVPIGAQLTVGTGQTDGTYTGTVTVTATFN